MIEINFPPNPEDYIFELHPRWASVYLLARAVQHYGADKLNVICTKFRDQEDFNTHRQLYNNIEELADKLGLHTVNYVWLGNVFPDFPRNATGDYDILKLKEVFTPAMHQIDESLNLITEDGDGYKFSKATAAKQVAVMAVMGLIGPDMVADPTRPHKKLFRWEAKSNNLQYQPIVDTLAVKGLDYMEWPLHQYTLAEIILSAQEEGLLDVVLSAKTCNLENRPYHCGNCRNCMFRRMTLLDLEIPDTARYE